MTTPSPTPYVKDVYSTDSAGSIAGEPLIPFIHDFYHYGSDDFDVADSDYLKSIIGFMAGVIAIGVILMLLQWLFQLCACCKCFRECCECCFNWTRNGGRCTVTLIFMIAAVFASAAYFGRNEFQTATQDIGDILYDLSDAFQVIEDSSDDLVTLAHAYNVSSRASNCTPGNVTSELVDATDSFGEAVVSINDLVSGIADKVDLAAKFFENKVPYYIDRGVGVIVGFIYLLVLLGIIATCTRWKCDDCIVTFIGSIALLFLILLVSFEVMISVTVADFCYAGPDQAILTAADRVNLDEGNMDLIEYYILCNGTNPLDDMFNQSVQAVKTLNDTIQDIYSSEYVMCDNQILSEITSLNSQTVDELETFGDSMGCQIFSSLYTRVFYDTICDEFTRGLFMLWASQVLAGFFLYLAFCIMPCAARSERAQLKKSRVYAADQYGLKYDDD